MPVQEEVAGQYGVARLPVDARLKRLFLAERKGLVEDADKVQQDLLSYLNTLHLQGNHGHHLADEGEHVEEA